MWKKRKNKQSKEPVNKTFAQNGASAAFDKLDPKTVDSKASNAVGDDGPVKPPPAEEKVAKKAVSKAVDKTSPYIEDYAISYHWKIKSPLICVHLLPADEDYMVHEKFLTDQSDYFKGLISSNLSEGRTRRVELQWNSAFDFRPAFSSTMEYLYGGDYKLPSWAKPRGAHIHAAHVYVFADRFVIRELKSIALRNFRKLLEDDKSHRLKVKDGKFSSRGPGCIGSKDPLLDLQAILLLKRLLYENAFEAEDDLVEANEPGEIEPCKDEKDAVGNPSDSGAGPSSGTGDSPSAAEDRKPYPDPRSDARKVFATYLAKNMPDLSRSQKFKELLSEGGDFAVDLLTHSPFNEGIKGEKEEIFSCGFVYD